jgi:hypothetical protein
LRFSELNFQLSALWQGCGFVEKSNFNNAYIEIVILPKYRMNPEKIVPLPPQQTRGKQSQTEENGMFLNLSQTVAVNSSIR